MTDWPGIKAGYEAGSGFRALAKAHGVSHVAIMKRKKADGWVRASEPEGGNLAGNQAVGGNHGGNQDSEADIERIWQERVDQIKRDHTGGKPLDERLKDARRYFDYHLKEFGYAPRLHGLRGAVGK